ncbi:uncharacterized protein [Symphalangus syndactylus]|uniref:uncharacterized protein n=1 Tax=Symphalangus syndactylus TaxID=9590 RepID=UPI0024410CCC|nr:uncharacterized protein LOC129464627 [Symphalangus syndactylus]
MGKKLDLQLLQLPSDLLSTSPNPGPTSAALTSKVSSSPVGYSGIKTRVGERLMQVPFCPQGFQFVLSLIHIQYPCLTASLVDLQQLQAERETRRGAEHRRRAGVLGIWKKRKAGGRRQGSSQTPGPRDSASSWVTRTQQAPGSRVPAVPARPPTRNRTLQTSDSVVPTSRLPPQDAVPRRPSGPLPSLPRSGSAVPTPGSLSSNQQPLEQRLRPSVGAIETPAAGQSGFKPQPRRRGRRDTGQLQVERKRRMSTVCLAGAVPQT